MKVKIFQELSSVTQLERKINEWFEEERPTIFKILQTNDKGLVISIFYNDTVPSFHESYTQNTQGQ